MIIGIKPIALTGIWDDGYALDLQTLRSVPIGPNQWGHLQFDTQRSDLGELVYKLKSLHDISVLPDITDTVADFIVNTWKVSNQIAMILPVPPSNLGRVIQPVIALAEQLSSKLSLPICHDLEKIRSTPEAKNIEEGTSRAAILKGAFKIPSSTTKDSSVLLIDDIFRSGETFTEITKTLQIEGGAAKVFVLALTKTRIKR